MMMMTIILRLSVDEVQAIDSESHDNNDERQQEQDDVDVMIGKIGDWFT